LVLHYTEAARRLAVAEQYDRQLDEVLHYTEAARRLAVAEQYDRQLDEVLHYTEAARRLAVASSMTGNWMKTSTSGKGPGGSRPISRSCAVPDPSLRRSGRGETRTALPTMG
jgi:hypothetical protein